MLTIQPMVIVAKKTMQADTLQNLIAWLRANPDKASQGTARAGSTSHLAGIFFQMATGTRYQFVPYRNTGMQDLMAGLIDLMKSARLELRLATSLFRVQNKWGIRKTWGLLGCVDC